MINIEFPNICSQCKGKCCQGYAGLCLPNDIGDKSNIVENSISLIKTGKWTIDCWEGDPRPNGKLGQVWFIRPAHKDSIGKLIDRPWGGVCCLWTIESGCSLTLEKRPFQCRVLRPKKSYQCGLNQQYGKEYVALKWIPFQDQVEEIISRCS